MIGAGCFLGKLETFAEHARIVHIDVDPAEINKNKEAHIPMFTSTKPALTALNHHLDTIDLPAGEAAAAKAVKPYETYKTFRKETPALVSRFWNPPPVTCCHTGSHT